MTKLQVTPNTVCHSIDSAQSEAEPGELHLAVNASRALRPPYRDVQITSSTNMAITRTDNGATILTEAVDRTGAAFRVEARLAAHLATVELTPAIDPLPVDWVADPLALWALMFDGCITMHAAAVTMGESVVIFTGFHNAGKTTTARSIAKLSEAAELLADDQLVIGFDGDRGVNLCAGYADELAGHQKPVVSEQVLIVVLGEPTAADGAGTWLSLSQFVVGLGFEATTTEMAADRLEQLLGRVDVVFAPARDLSGAHTQIMNWLKQAR